MTTVKTFSSNDCSLSNQQKQKSSNEKVNQQDIHGMFLGEKANIT